MAWNYLKGIETVKLKFCILITVLLISTGDIKCGKLESL